jgi:PAS domain S-box-containing protein
MSKYSTISVPKELHDELRENVKHNPRLGYSSIAEFCKEAIRLHVANIRNERREAFLQRVDIEGLLRKVDIVSTVEGGQYRRIFETCTDPAFIIAADGSILNCNQQLIDQLGYNEKEDLLGRDVSTLFADQGQLNDVMIQAQDNMVRDRDVKLKRRDGKTLDFLLSVGTITEGEGATRYVGTGKDITVRKMAEDRLKKEHTLFSTILNEVYDSILIFQNDRIQYATGKCHISGYTPEELEGMDLMDIVAPESREKVKENKQKRLEGEDISPIQRYTVLTRDGEKRRIEVSSEVITYEGQPALLAVVRAADNDGS